MFKIQSKFIVQLSKKCFLLSLVILCFACKNVIEERNTIKTSSLEDQTEREFSLNPKIFVNSEAIEAKINNNKESEWKIHKNLSGKDFSITNLFFLDKKVGWAVNNKFVYKTLDSGKKWEISPLSIDDKSEVNTIYFEDQNVGWLVAQYNWSKHSYSEKDRVDIYKTEDGGKTWELSYSEKSAVYRNSYFRGENMWILGHEFLGYYPQRLAPLALHFDNKTKGWRNVSQNVKKIYQVNHPEQTSYLDVQAITSDVEKCVAAMTIQGKIIKSCDNGENWNIFGDFDNGLYPMGVIGFEFTENNLILLQATGGVEGTESQIGKIPVNGNRNEIEFIDFGGYYLSSQYVFSDQEIIVAGDKLNEVFNKKTGLYDFVKYGVVLLSENGGKTWIEIYKGQPREWDRKRNTIFVVNSHLIWLIDDKGKLIKLSRI